MVTPNKNQKEKKIKLSIQVSLNGLSFCGLSQEENKIVFFKDIPFGKELNPIQILQKIEKLYEQEDFLREQDAEVLVLYSNELYTLVPQAFFSEENASDYLKYNTRILETDYIAQDALDEERLITVYIPFTNINNFFFEKYGEFEYRHCISLLVEELLKLNGEGTANPKVYLNCYTGGYDLVAVKNGKLLLANSFKCSTKEDFIYYLLFTAEQLELDPNSLELILLGKVTENSDYYRIAYTYIKNVGFLKTSFGYRFAVNEDPPKGYMYYTLLKAAQ